MNIIITAGVVEIYKGPQNGGKANPFAGREDPRVLIYGDPQFSEGIDPVSIDKNPLRSHVKPCNLSVKPWRRQNSAFNHMIIITQKKMIPKSIKI